MDSMFNKIQEKLHQAKISNVNYQLGKAKESLLSGSANYFRSFRPDQSSNVGSLIRSESTRFGELLGLPAKDQQPSEQKQCCNVPKSTSLPSLRRPDLNNRYKYKSSEEQPDLVSKEQTVLDRFIRVVEEDVSEQQHRRRKRRGKIESREDIRRRLADWDSSRKASNHSGGKEGNLQICFINEIVSEEDEEEEEDDDEGKKNLKEESLGNKLKAIKREAERKLRACQTQQRRGGGGGSKEPASQSQTLQDILSSYGINPTSSSKSGDPRSLNIASLQIIVNHYHSQIEKLNGELVKGLLEKDELQIEQEGQLCDIEDLISSSR